jgi:hypothetical protein
VIDMNDDKELDPVARLRAADPAAEVEPRDRFADEVVARATAEPTAGPASAPVSDLTAERARRRPRWLPIAAVAASIAVVGALGYGAGAMTGGATNLADGAAPPISLQSGAGQESDVQTSVPDAALGGQKMSQFGATDMMYPYGFGRNSFSSSGLATDGGTAVAYAFDARATASAETIAALAAALGIDGAPVQANGGWNVGPQDGTAPSLSIGLDGTLNFYYMNPLVSPWQCAQSSDPNVPCEPTPPGEETLPSEDAAIEALRSIIVSVGRDPATFEFTSETYEGAVSRTAQAWPVVDGQRLDQAWSLELATDGVFSVNGALAGIVELGEYAVVSEQEGFERLSDPRFGAHMTNMPIALGDEQLMAPEEWVPPTEPPATPKEGTSISWPVNQVEIVSARLGLASQWQPDGSVLVVPSYEFTDSQGGTWSVIAVADSELDFESE